MSDDLKKAFQEMRMDLGAVKERLAKVETLQRKTADLQRTTADETAEASKRFDTFLSRFDEVSDMLIQHDTEQLRRVTAVENQNDGLKAIIGEVLEKYKTLERRLEALEKKAS